MVEINCVYRHYQEILAPIHIYIEEESQDSNM
jgi:hypothetical protein